MGEIIRFAWGSSSLGDFIVAMSYKGCVKYMSTFRSSEKFRRAMADLGVTFESLNEAAAVKAAEAWRRYRARGGRRTRIVSDFLIGADVLQLWRGWLVA